MTQRRNMINAKEARELATSFNNKAKEKQFIRFTNELNKTINNGHTSFTITQIALIKEDIEKLGYKIERKDGEYNSTVYEVSF